MKNTSCMIPLCILFTLSVNQLYAQDLNSEMKKKLRQSFTMPEKENNQNQLQHTPTITHEREKEVLKVSPFTKLPTKLDRIKVLHPLEEFKVHVNLSPTNARPIDERPPGSVRYEFVGKNMQMISTAGTRPQSSIDTGPIRKRHKRKANILKPLQK